MALDHYGVWVAKPVRVSAERIVEFRPPSTGAPRSISSESPTATVRAFTTCT